MLQTCSADGRDTNVVDDACARLDMSHAEGRLD